MINCQIKNCSVVESLKLIGDRAYILKMFPDRIFLRSANLPFKLMMACFALKFQCLCKDKAQKQCHKTIHNNNNKCSSM